MYIYIHIYLVYINSRGTTNFSGQEIYPGIRGLR